MGMSNSLLSKIGLGALVISGLALLVTIVYAILGASGAITVNSADDLAGLITNGIIATAIIFGFGLIGALLFTPGILATPRVNVVQFASAIVLLIVGGVLLFGVMTPRAVAAQQTANVATFAKTVKDNCQTPLQQIVDDLRIARDHAIFATSDAGAADLMNIDAANLKRDEAGLAVGAGNLSVLTAPDPTYGPLVRECLSSINGEQYFLDHQALPDLGAPLNAVLTPGMSGLKLLSTGAVLASGKGPIQLPPGTVQKIVAQVFGAAAASTNPDLNRARDYLKSSLKQQITDESSPFGVNIPDLN